MRMHGADEGAARLRLLLYISRRRCPSFLCGSNSFARARLCSSFALATSGLPFTSNGSRNLFLGTEDGSAKCTDVCSCPSVRVQKLGPFPFPSVCHTEGQPLSSSPSPLYALARAFQGSSPSTLIKREAPFCPLVWCDCTHTEQQSSSSSSQSSFPSPFSPSSVSSFLPSLTVSLSYPL